MRKSGARAEQHNDAIVAESTIAMDAGEDLYDSYDGENYVENADPNNGGNGSQSPDVKADAAKEMLVFRCNIAIDTLNFDESLVALKNKIEEYHGFIERENQTDGSSGNGRYVIDEEDKDYYYTATIRIPSAYYDSFVNATSGIGTLRSKNSSVDNVATRYGTLQNELEIYEAEYDRYMKQYEETEDESIALQIQYELRNLAITISDIKTEMSMLESDVAYSYVSITIHKVSQKEIEKEQEEVTEKDSFGTRLSKTAKNSWNDFLGFLQGIVLFFVGGWWVILILGLIAFAIFFGIKRSIKKGRERSEAKRKQLEAEQFERMKAYQMAKEQTQAANQAQIQARINSQKTTVTEKTVPVPQSEKAKEAEKTSEEPKKDSDEEKK
ncbi:MAG: DUF4349 domain-containing protein [Clostridiales bacterium]|nr:DUF4349 domain-containing protein [Clostridiales bacterium]